MVCAVILGYRGGDSSSGILARMLVSQNTLVLRSPHADDMVFTPEDVVEIRTDRVFLQPSALIIDHVLFDKIPFHVVVSPIDETCKTLLARIKMAGFCPKAEPVIPWEIPEPPSPFV